MLLYSSLQHPITIHVHKVTCLNKFSSSIRSSHKIRMHCGTKMIQLAQIVMTSLPAKTIGFAVGRIIATYHYALQKFYLYTNTVVEPSSNFHVQNNFIFYVHNILSSVIVSCDLCIVQE